MVSENETWLVNIGGDVIEKESKAGRAALSEVEWAIYCFWVVDYSVRNSGTLGAVEDIHSEALSELNEFAQKNHCKQLSRISDGNNTKDEEYYCEEFFYELFESACNEIRMLYKGT